MYYLVDVDYRGMVTHLTRSDCEGCISNAVDETDDMLWNYSEENGDVRNEYEEDEDIVYEDGDSDTAW